MKNVDVCVCVCFACKYFMKSNSTFSLHCCGGTANNANATSSRVPAAARFYLFKKINILQSVCAGVSSNAENTDCSLKFHISF